INCVWCATPAARRVYARPLNHRAAIKYASRYPPHLPDAQTNTHRPDHRAATSYPPPVPRHLPAPPPAPARPITQWPTNGDTPATPTHAGQWPDTRSSTVQTPYLVPFSSPPNPLLLWRRLNHETTRGRSGSPANTTTGWITKLFMKKTRIVRVVAPVSACRCANCR